MIFSRRRIKSRYVAAIRKTATDGFPPPSIRVIKLNPWKGWETLLAEKRAAAEEKESQTP